HDPGGERRRARLQPAQPRGRHRRRRLLRPLPRHDLCACEGRSAVLDAPDDPADPVKRPVVIAAALAVLASAGAAGADPPQQFVLPGPVPYPTPVPPLIGTTALQQTYIAPRVHISSSEHVLVGVDGEGRPTAVRVRQRLVVEGKGDYQLAISGPIDNVTA